MQTWHCLFKGLSLHPIWWRRMKQSMSKRTTTRRHVHLSMFKSPEISPEFGMALNPMRS